jgi:hypothetical protein
MASTSKTAGGRWRYAAVAAALLPAVVLAAPGTDLDREPFLYGTTAADNAVTRLQAAIDQGRARLTHDEEHGYLRSVLKELDVPESSQVLVFSKTSLQRHRIVPKTPRAIYFNDVVFVGFCLRGDVVEVSAADPRLGTAFYTLPQRPAEQPRFQRQQDNCLICHGSSATQGLPGHVVRSVFADRGGLPILSEGGYRTNQASPMAERWGGWYVTGTTGGQEHMGNRVYREGDRDGGEGGGDVTDLADRFTTGLYPTPHSDVVALMVLEHQAEAHNLITRANYLTRQALYQEADINKALGRPLDERSESTTRRIRGAGEALVKYLLFSGEAKLTGPVKGTSAFAEEFARRGPHDARGRSLREFDLTRRLFKYPCSYLVYTKSFDALPGPVKDHVLRRLWEVLGGQDRGPDFAHLSAEDRRAILEILRETKPDLPEYWKRP